MIHNKKGFTLIEMMIVLALVGLFFVITSSFSNDARINQTNAERFANNVYDTIRSARNNMLIGRGAYSGTNLVTVTERTVLISNTGVTTLYLHDASSSGVESTLPFPFFDNDKQYVISNIAVSSGGVVSGKVPVWESSGMTSATITMNAASDINITTVPVPPGTIRTLKVTAKYGDFEQSVIVDRVTGDIEVKKSNDD